MKQEQVTMPTKATESTTIYESKHFPFQIVEITTSKNNKEKKTFKIGMCGQFVSEKTFTELDKAEKYISSRPWELITNMVCVTIKNAIEYERSQSKS